MLTTINGRDSNMDPFFPAGSGWAVGLLMLVVFLAIAVVYSSYVTRGKIAMLQDLQTARDQMHVEWSQLVLEQNSLGSYSRVEKQATKKLDMFVPNSNEIVMVRSSDMIVNGVAAN